MSDSEDEVAESAIDKPKSVDKKNVLDDYWIHDIETPLKCNGENCSKKKIKGLWYTHDKKDYCSDCSALLEFETYNIFEPTLAEKKDSELMRAIRLKDEDLALGILEDNNIMEKTDINKKDLIGFSAVFLAILYLPGIKLLSRLIKNEAEIDYETDTGKTPLLTWSRISWSLA